MALVVKISVKDFNAGKLVEEIAAAALPVDSISWAGFLAKDERVYTPFSESSKVIGYSSNKGNDIAQKGELRFTTSRALSGAEESSLTALLAAHDSTKLSAAQIDQDADKDTFDALIAEKKPIYLAHMNNWDTYNNTQKTAATKELFEIVYDVMRLFLKTYPA